MIDQVEMFDIVMRMVGMEVAVGRRPVEVEDEGREKESKRDSGRDDMSLCKCSEDAEFTIRGTRLVSESCKLVSHPTSLVQDGELSPRCCHFQFGSSFTACHRRRSNLPDLPHRRTYTTLAEKKTLRKS